MAFALQQSEEFSLQVCIREFFRLKKGSRGVRPIDA